MLEAARHHPPVGGMNPIAVPSQEIKLSNGKALKVSDRQAGIIFTSTSNFDPSVFAEPEEFRPGRENALRVLSWNNEVGDFRKCETVAGCPEAPRGCPGMRMSLRLVTK